MARSGKELDMNQWPSLLVTSKTWAKQGLSLMDIHVPWLLVVRNLFLSTSGSRQPIVTAVENKDISSLIVLNFSNRSFVMDEGVTTH